MKGFKFLGLILFGLMILTPKTEAATAEGFVHERGISDTLIKAYTPGVPNDTIRDDINTAGLYSFYSTGLGSNFNVAGQNWEFTITNLQNLPGPIDVIYPTDVYPNGVSAAVWKSKRRGSGDLNIIVTNRKNNMTKVAQLPPESERGLTYRWLTTNVETLNVRHGDTSDVWYFSTSGDNWYYNKLVSVQDTTRHGYSFYVSNILFTAS